MNGRTERIVAAEKEQRVDLRQEEIGRAMSLRLTRRAPP